MTPVIAQKSPYPLVMTAGQTVYWCLCGKSSKQSLCDGSHKATGLTPMPFTGEKDGTVYFCGCKQSKTPQTCDGSHTSL